MRIHEVVITVGDVAEAVAFYTDVVGLEHVRTVEQDGHEVAELTADGQRITLVAGEQPGVTLAFEAASIGSRKRRLARHDVSVPDGAPIEIPGGAWLPFSDPWGNALGYWEDRPEEGSGTAS